MATRRWPKFAADISRARDLIGLGQSFGAMTHGLVDASDMNRAGLVQAVAALDHYFHGVVLDRAVDIVMGRLAVSSVNSRVGLHFDALQDILSATTPADRELAARTHLAARLGRETFQRAESISEALSMVGVSKIWAVSFPGGAKPAMTALNVIVDRRNRIVHQADSDPLVLGAVTPLSDTDAQDAVRTVESSVRAIDPLC